MWVVTILDFMQRIWLQDSHFAVYHTGTTWQSWCTLLHLQLHFLGCSFLVEVVQVVRAAAVRGTAEFSCAVRTICSSIYFLMETFNRNYPSCAYKHWGNPALLQLALLPLQRDVALGFVAGPWRHNQFWVESKRICQFRMVLNESWYHFTQALSQIAQFRLFF